MNYIQPPAGYVLLADDEVVKHGDLFSWNDGTSNEWTNVRVSVGYTTADYRIAQLSARNALWCRKSQPAAAPVVEKEWLNAWD